MMTYGFRPEWSGGGRLTPDLPDLDLRLRLSRRGRLFRDRLWHVREATRKNTPAWIYWRINRPNLEIAEERLALWTVPRPRRSSSRAWRRSRRPYGCTSDRAIVAAWSPSTEVLHHFIETVLFPVRHRGGAIRS